MSTLEELSKEYVQICNNIGDAQIKIARLHGFIESEKNKVLELDKKAAELEKKPSEEKPKVEDAPAKVS